jgi:hypothetical protein
MLIKKTLQTNFFSVKQTVSTFFNIRFHEKIQNPNTVKQILVQKKASFFPNECKYEVDICPRL